jgi:hypothetical protein
MRCGIGGRVATKANKGERDGEGEPSLKSQTRYTDPTASSHDDISTKSVAFSVL